MRVRVFVMNVTLVSVLWIGGCAQVTVHQVANAYGSTGVEVKPSDTSGVRFYRPRLHVWITKSAPSEKVNIATAVEAKTTTVVSIKDTGYAAAFVFLPDYSQEYIIRWNARIGSIKPEFSLNDGWNLTKFAGQVDTKSAENLGAVSSFITAAAGALAAEEAFTGAGLYRMDVDQNGKWSLGTKVLSLE